MADAAGAGPLKALPSRSEGVVSDGIGRVGPGSVKAFAIPGGACPTPDPLLTIRFSAGACGGCGIGGDGGDGGGSAGRGGAGIVTIGTGT